jgi:hypothetical protein
MAIYHITPDANGDTHLRQVDLPVSDTPAGRVASTGEIPALRASIAEFVDTRKPDSGLHTAPCRQFVGVLRGVMEIETSLGEKQLFHPGDFMIADDVVSNGHHTRDVGDVPLSMMTIGVPEDWMVPGS